MLLGDLKNGNTFFIELKQNDKVLSMESTVVELSEPTDVQYADMVCNKLNYLSYCILKPVKNKTSIVNFRISGVRIKVSAMYTEKLYSWEDVRIELINLPVYGAVHICFSNKDVNPYNNRTEYRLHIGEPAKFSIAGKKERFYAILKDVSEHGACLIVNISDGIKAGDTLDITYTDRELNAETKQERNINYQLCVTVVRVALLDKEHNLLGCIAEMDPEVGKKLIFHKQREKLRQGGRNALLYTTPDDVLVENLEKVRAGQEI